MNTSEYNNAVDMFADGLYRYALSFCKNTQQAEDVVQTCFEKVWERKGDIDSAKVKSYLFTVAHNQLINNANKEKRYSTEPIKESQGRVFYMENPDLQEVLHRALSQLPESQRSAVLLKDYEGYSYKEIGEMLELSESQVKVYIFRARKALRKIIGNLESVL